MNKNMLIEELLLYNSGIGAIPPERTNEEILNDTKNLKTYYLGENYESPLREQPHPDNI